MIQASLILSYSSSKIHCEWYRDDCTKQLAIRDKVKLFVGDKTLIDKNYEVLSIDNDLKLQSAHQFHSGKGGCLCRRVPKRLPKKARKVVFNADQNRV